MKCEHANKKGGGDRDRKREVQKRLNEVAAKIDEFEKKIKIPKLLSELTEELIKIENIVPQYDETIANPDSSYYLVKAPLSPKTIGAVIKAYRGSSSYTEFSQILNAVGIIFNDQESG